MSYYFQVKSDTKAEALAAVMVELDKAIDNQPAHAIYRQAVEDTVKTFVAMTREPTDGASITILVSGSIYQQDSGVGINITTHVS
jgi:hypothetical protein